MVDSTLLIPFETVLGVLLIAGFIFLYRKYKRTTHRIVLFLALLFLCGALEMLLRAVTEVNWLYTGGRNDWVYFPGKWMVVPRTLAIITIFEFMNRESIRIGLVIYWAVASALLIVLDTLWLFSSGSPPLLAILLDKGGDLAYYLLTLTGIVGVQVAYKIFKNAPSSLKKHASWFFKGFLLTGVSLAFMELDRIIDMVAPFRIPAGVILFIGLFIIVATLSRSPQLAYILPFKVFRLSVINIEAGTSIFGHTWEAGKHFIDEDLYTGMVQGVRQILTESMRQGDLEEIKTEYATLLLQRRKDVPIMFCLATSGPSMVLKNVLNVFATEFCNQFGEYCNNTANTTPFQGAIALVEKLFLFVPK